MHQGSLWTPATSVKSDGLVRELRGQYRLYQRLVFIDKPTQRMARFLQMSFVHR